jgi:hypothetical protein
MVEEPAKDVGEMTVSELRALASELEITGRSSMRKDELRQAVIDAQEQLGGALEVPSQDFESEFAPPFDREPSQADDGEVPASEIPAPSIGPKTEIHKDPPEERLAKHEQSDVDAMGLNKRRAVVGARYGASFAKQAAVYGVFLVVLAALVVGGKLAADELDKGPEVNADEAPWSQADAEQTPPGDPDFPPGVTP